MKIEEIKELIQALEQSNLTSLEVVEGDSCVRMEKQQRPMELVAPQVVSAQEVPAAKMLAQQNSPVEEKPQTVGNPVKSPLVGVFYAAPSPNDEPYVTVGTAVKKGDVLCIVEAMKLMNEITAEQDGVIAEVCVENGEVVEYGQTLFMIQ